MKKILSCILSCLPFIMIILTFIVYMTALLLFGDGTPSVGEMLLMIGLIIFALADVILTYFVMGWYMIKTCKNPKFSTGMKILWCALLYCFNMFIFPVYWILYIREEK